MPKAPPPPIPAWPTAAQPMPIAAAGGPPTAAAGAPQPAAASRSAATSGSKRAADGGGKQGHEQLMVPMAAPQPAAGSSATASGGKGTSDGGGEQGHDQLMGTAPPAKPPTWCPADGKATVVATGSTDGQFTVLLEQWHGQSRHRFLLKVESSHVMHFDDHSDQTAPMDRSAPSTRPPPPSWIAPLKAPPPDRLVAAAEPKLPPAHLRKGRWL